MRVSENRILRKIFGPEREQVVGHWKRVYNVELHNMYASPNIMGIKSRRIRRMGHVAHMVEMRNSYKTLVRKPEGKRPLGRQRHR